jgi:hypothetical protein
VTPVVPRDRRLFFRCFQFPIITPEHWPRAPPGQQAARSKYPCCLFPLKRDLPGFSARPCDGRIGNKKAKRRTPMKRRPELYRTDWNGILLEITYEPVWMPAHIMGEDVAHIEVRSIYPTAAPLPIAKAGFYSKRRRHETEFKAR